MQTNSFSEITWSKYSYDFRGAYKSQRCQGSGKALFNHKEQTMQSAALVMSYRRSLEAFGARFQQLRGQALNKVSTQYKSWGSQCWQIGYFHAAAIQGIEQTIADLASFSYLLILGRLVPQDFVLCFNSLCVKEAYVELNYLLTETSHSEAKLRYSDVVLSSNLSDQTLFVIFKVTSSFVILSISEI